MFQYQCLNPISKVGLDGFTNDYIKTEEIEKADAILVRSASMHEMKLPENIQAIARAGAGVNNIPLKDCAEQGIVVFNTPGANANGVKEMVIAGMLLASRDIVGGVEWVKQEKDNENVGKLAEKEKTVCRLRDQRKETRCHRSGSHRSHGCQHCHLSWYGSIRI